MIENQSFEGIKLLIRSVRGRVTRLGTLIGSDNEDFRSIILRKFNVYITYLDALITQLDSYFEPWPEWVIFCNDSLDFENDLEFSERKESF